jgi:hypothetical protein
MFFIHFAFIAVIMIHVVAECVEKFLFGWSIFIAEFRLCVLLKLSSHLEHLTQKLV